MSDSSLAATPNGNVAPGDGIIVEDDGAAAPPSDAGAQPAAPSPYADEIAAVPADDRGAGSDEDVAWATRNGWVPREKWRGDALDWVDAGTFASRSRGINHVLRDQNQRLERQLQEMRDRMDQAATTTTQRTLTETQAQLAGARIRAREARESSDFDAYDLAQTDIKRLEGDEARLKQPQRAPGITQADAEAARSWDTQNQWYKKDIARTRMYDAVCMDVRRNFPNIIGNTAAFLAEADRVAARDYPEYFGGRMATSRTNGGQPARPAAPTSRKKGWDDLPQEAKTVAEQLIRRNPKLKREDYASEFFAEQGQ